MAIFRIVHNNKFAFSASVENCAGSTYLSPRKTSLQTVKFHQLVFTPLAHFQQVEDSFGNHRCDFMISRTHQTLALSSISTVHTSPRTPTEPHLNSTIAEAQQCNNEEVSAFRKSTHLTTSDKHIEDYANQLLDLEQALFHAVSKLSNALYRDFRYDVRAASSDTTAIQTMQRQHGVCQDLAHLAIACLRAKGIAARYVSGYVDTQGLRETRRVGGDMSHAWFSVYCPRNGWIDFDPTNNQQPNDTYITLAWGRDYADVAPISGGATGGGLYTMSVSVDVQRLS